VALLVADEYAVGGINDRLVLLVPVHPVVLMPGLTEDLNDQPPTGGLTVDTASLKPVADSRRSGGAFGAHMSD